MRQHHTSCLCVLFSLSLLSPARGEEAPIGAAQMQGQGEMHRYFEGERRGGIWLMSAGVPALALGTGLLFQEGDFARGLAYPLLVFGAIDLIGGVVFYVNTARRVPRFDRQLREAPAAFRDAELSRIRGVNRDMRLIEAVEISLILAGGAMTSIGALQGQDLLAGIGTGILLESAILLVYDQFAARRALRYTDRLLRFNVSPLRAGGALLSMQRTF